MSKFATLWLSLVTLLGLFTSGSGSAMSRRTFTIFNKCDYTVWPGVLSNAGVPPFPTTGFALLTGESKSFDAPASWRGRFWGRTHCSAASAGKFSCLTADCGSDKLECSGNGASLPATLAEFTLDGAGGMDFFDVSVVDGYNLPMLVERSGGAAGGENCMNVGCPTDLNQLCPSELKVSGSDGGAVACKSACEAFGTPEYCCSGAYATPDTCKPSSYSQVFKSACPKAYSYAYDDGTSTFTCAGGDYTITFCPAATPTTTAEEVPSITTNSSPITKNSPPITATTRSSPPPAAVVHGGGAGDFFDLYQAYSGGLRSHPGVGGPTPILVVALNLLLWWFLF